MPDSNPSERLAEIEARVEAGKKQARQIADDIDVACSVPRFSDMDRRHQSWDVLVGRDWLQRAGQSFARLSDCEDIPWLLEREKKLREAHLLEHGEDADTECDCWYAKIALADSGEASGEAG